jgi:hypothetical protein
MVGPGRDVPAPTAGLIDGKDLPAPHLGLESRHHQHTPCPRCGPLASRHTSAPRTLHDRGDVATGRPVALLVTSSSPPGAPGQQSCTLALSALAPPGRQDTNRGMDLAVRVVGEESVPYRPARWPLWRAPRVLVPWATLHHGGEAGGKKGARAPRQRVSGVGAGDGCGLCRG